MSNTYKIIGIIVKKQPFGENDLLITFLSSDNGLVKVIAPKARNHKSTLRGKTELLIVNHFSILKGKNLDRIIEIDTIKSYPKLTQSIEKLMVTQYLAELILNLGMIEQSQSELYTLFNEHLHRIEKLSINESLFPYLSQAVFHFLAVTGIAPNAYYCVKTQQPINPNFDQKDWKVGFSFEGGGIINHHSNISSTSIDLNLNALELALLQSLSDKTIFAIPENIPSFYSHSHIEKAWIRVEKILKDYLEFYLGHALKSAQIMTEILGKTLVPLS
ncbi:DNA repair protein RecO [Geminocystis sp. NIES-3709]|uniref:DNA repair protein RecO n=1 Tax=Geminocystis sp. NIES-3709 TaxID=1617448 RepID=UPI0005FCB263|nr:DNA repair protein RecO [Geminocystis sp. NIES-3709]BAQ66802.1 DNA recombination and repair protein RecO [Geminocystis sp. NIES-3709]